MRIAVWHDVPGGGGKRALLDHLRGLVRRGHEIESFTPGSRDRDFLPLAALGKEHVLPLPAFPEPRPKGHLAQALWRLRELRFALRALEEHCRSAAEAIAAGGFDVLFANTAVRFHAPPLARFARIPALLYLQEPNRRLHEALPAARWAAPPAVGPRLSRERLTRAAIDQLDTWGRRVQVREEIASAAAFDRVLVNSRFSRESVLRAYGLESEVCLLGVDTERFRPAGVARGDHVIGCGTLYWGKGVELALRALGRIEPALRPPLRWVAPAENRRYAAAMQALAEELGVRLRVQMRVGDDELVRLLSGARALLCTSRLEPFGLTPLEANACGTPVVALAEGGLRESIEDGVNGVLVESADPEALARALEELLRDPARAEALGRRGHERVLERFERRHAVERLEGHLEALLGRDGRGPEHRASPRMARSHQAGRLHSAPLSLPKVTTSVTPGAAASLHASMRERYLELLKRILLNEIYREAEPHDSLRIDEGRVWPRYAHTMIGRARLDTVQQCIEAVVAAGTPGDLIESGVWRGGCSILMKAVLESLGDGARRVVLADSFEGMPLPTPGVEEDQGTKWHRFEQLAVPLQTVEENFRRYDLLDDRVEFVKGPFRETMPRLAGRCFALVRVDCDTYDATRVVLEALYDAIPPGGWLLCDDYGEPSCWMARKAVDDFREKRGIREPIRWSDHSGIYWRKEPA